MKCYLVLSCNTEGGDMFVEGIFKSRNTASGFLKKLTKNILDNLIENEYGKSYDDFEYYTDEDIGEIDLGDCTYYLKVDEIDTDKAV